MGLVCERFHCSPNELGVNMTDTRKARIIRLALNVYTATSDRERAKDKKKWGADNPDSLSLIRWARNADDGISAPNEFKFQLLPKPKDMK